MQAKKIVFSVDELRRLYYDCIGHEDMSLEKIQEQL